MINTFLAHSDSADEAAPASAPVKAAREWSPYQAAVFADVESGEGNTIVSARAGSGKTSTIVEALRYLPPGSKALLVAFNKNIAQELSTRAPKGVDVMTLHSYGLRAVKARNRAAEIDSDKSRNIARELYGDDAKFFGAALPKAVGLAKNLLLSTAEEIDAVLDGYGVDIPGPATAAARAKFVAAVVAVVEASKRDLDTIDFDDMIWLPVVLRLPTPRYARVFVDETQDLNPCQIELVLGSVATGGRVTAVGDDRQAIYGFRGADRNAMERVRAALGAKVLPLSITYRCATAIVKVAQAIVPDLEAAPGAAEGSVAELPWAQASQRLEAGDMVISRTNAPLVRELLRAVRAGRRATMLGRDFGQALTGLIRKSKAATIAQLDAYIDQWEAREVARLDAKGRDTGAVRDRADTLRALAEGATSPEQVISTIERYFAENAAKDAVVFSSTHKAKGLEAHRVVLFADTYRPGRSVEEDNLWYVAVTRAKVELVLAYGAGQDDEQGAA